MTRLYCIPTNQGTGTPETCLCEEHFDGNQEYARKQAQKTTDIDPTAPFVECTGNDALVCCICGRRSDGTFDNDHYNDMTGEYWN